jgi:tetratricopeptide (TPR) repeat protein
VLKTPLPIVIPLLLLAGLTLAASPNLERALESQHQLVAAEPGNATAYNDLGNLLLLAGREGEAEDAYRRALEIDPGSVSAHFNLAVLLQQNGRLEEAREQFQQLIEISPRHGWAHYQLGMLAAERGNRSKALEHYARAFAYDTSLTFAKTNPHIIDNPLATEALLLSSRYRQSAATQVPRQYADPERIAEWLLAEEPGMEEEAGAEAEEEADVEEELPVRKRRNKRKGAKAGQGDGEPVAAGEEAMDEEEVAAADEGKERVLTNQDLEEGGSLNQASGGASVGYRGRSTSRSRSELIRERFNQRRDRTPPPPTTGREDQSSPTRTGVAPGNVRYRPGRFSTGRLELRLLPEEEPAEQRAAVGVPATR